MNNLRKFNVNDYEPVKQRKKRFYEIYQDGRIVVESIRSSETEALMKASVYKNRDDQKEGLPFSTGYAQEFKGAGSFANKTSWQENCEESAIGRALDNAGFASNMGPSREEMQKVERAAQSTQQTQAPTKSEHSKLITELVNTVYDYSLTPDVVSEYIKKVSGKNIAKECTPDELRQVIGEIKNNSIKSR